MGLVGGEYVQLRYTIHNASRQSPNQYTSHHSKPAASPYMVQQYRIHNAANWSICLYTAQSNSQAVFHHTAKPNKNRSG